MDVSYPGPYRFREKRRHVNITWHENNGTVAYRTERSWFFDEATSNGTLQDNITTLNVIAAVSKTLSLLILANRIFLLPSTVSGMTLAFVEWDANRIIKKWFYFN